MATTYEHAERACDVCRLVDGDNTAKAVKRCATWCRAWVCRPCWFDAPRRALAAARHVLRVTNA